jgi:hypothetical protein
VQLTKFSRWNESPINNPVDTTNEVVDPKEPYSRGVASTVGWQGSSKVMAAGHPGNIGLTDTDPIEGIYDDNGVLNFTTTSAAIMVESMTGEEPIAIDPDLTVISGTITSGLGGALSATSVTISSTDSECDRTVDGFTCTITGPEPIIKVFGYGNVINSVDADGLPIVVIDRLACSSGLTFIAKGYDLLGGLWTTFSLKGTDQSSLYNIFVTRNTSC